MPEVQYITTKEAAKKWGITQRRVLALCEEDRIPGLARLGNMWIIPSHAPKPADGRSLRYTSGHTAEIHPFVKWAGGKGGALPELRKAYPPQLGRSIKKYAEPFVGGGAVLFDVLSRYELSEVFICDSNPQLMNAYRCIRDHADTLIHRLKKLEKSYLSLSSQDRKAFYYEKRERFNGLSRPATIEAAALFVFLNRTCFNGLYRVNGKGRFNVPMGAYKNPTICDAKNLYRLSDALQGVTLCCGDYRQAEQFIDEKTFVYFDPPYRPLSTTSSFTSYTQGGFDDEAQRQLAEFFRRMDQKGAALALSNSDPKNSDEHDSFFDELYSGYNITRIQAARSINSKSAGRGKISELLITNY